MFVIPSIICGYIGSIPALYFVEALMFKNQSIDIKPVPAAGATVQALILGLMIPLISAIIPIQSALSKNLNESMNNTRSKTKGQKVEISD